jgi:carbonic anhydrase
MDARIDPLALLGFEFGDAHVLRNGGAVVTDDVVRSLVLSQRKLGTRSVAVIAHTDCGIEGLNATEFASELTWETGSRPEFPQYSFDDIDEHVRVQLDRLRACPWLLHVDDVRGYVFDTADGSVRAVDG